MKKTAVEWLEFRYKNNITLNQYDFEQAKEMEKKQIVSALKAGVNFEINCNIDSNTNLTYDEYFTKYYNKTYKK